MASHLNENAEVKEEHSSEEKRSQSTRLCGILRRRRRRAPHSGTNGTEFTVTTCSSKEFFSNVPPSRIRFPKFRFCKFLLKPKKWFRPRQTISFGPRHDRKSEYAPFYGPGEGILGPDHNPPAIQVSYKRYSVVTPRTLLWDPKTEKTEKLSIDNAEEPVQEIVNHAESDLVPEENQILATAQDGSQLTIANGVVPEQDQLSNDHDGSLLTDAGEANVDSENDPKQATSETDSVNIGMPRRDEDNNNHDDSGSKDAGEANVDTEYDPKRAMSEADSVNIPILHPDGDNNNHNDSSSKGSLGLAFAIFNFILELPSVVFDQLSSTNHHPHYALIMMLFSFIALMSCIGELICKGVKAGVTWQWRDRLASFNRPTDKPFVTLWEIIGFACAFLQCVVSAINYSFISRHLDGPIKASFWPILFAFGLLWSKCMEKPDTNGGGNPPD